jgi:flagellar biosynthesis/type III secretory pathway M-ring protein FliF/YscJ
VIALTLRVLAPFLVVGILVLLLRWTWGKGHSLAQRTPRIGTPGDYGLLVPVAAPTNRADAAAIGTRLDEAGIRYTLANTKDGMRILVFEDDAERARALLR